MRGALKGAARVVGLGWMPAPGVGCWVVVIRKTGNQSVVVLWVSSMISIRELTPILR